MSGLIYGFVVAAWLVFDIGHTSTDVQRIPFASMAACQDAQTILRKRFSTVYRYHINCLPTGIKERG